MKKPQPTIASKARECHEVRILAHEREPFGDAKEDRETDVALQKQDAMISALVGVDANSRNVMDKMRGGREYAVSARMSVISDLYTLKDFSFFACCSL